MPPTYKREIAVQSARPPQADRAWRQNQAQQTQCPSAYIADRKGDHRADDIQERKSASIGQLDNIQNKYAPYAEV